jgi:hypothetical protein
VHRWEGFGSIFCCCLFLLHAPSCVVFLPLCPAHSNSQVGTCSTGLVLFALIYLFFTVTNRTDCLLDTRAGLAGWQQVFFFFFLSFLGGVSVELTRVGWYYTPHGNATWIAQKTHTREMRRNKTGTCNERRLYIRSMQRSLQHMQKSL